MGNTSISFQNHPTIYNFINNDVKFYGLTKAGHMGKFTNSVVNSPPFTKNPDWGFLDYITVGSFVVDSYENFKYLCSTGEKDRIISGNFSNDDPLENIYEKSLRPLGYDPHFNSDHNYGIYNDPERVRMLIVNNDFINIYDASNYATCDNLILVDSIALKKTKTTELVWGATDITFGDSDFTFSSRYCIENPNNPKFIKFGNKLRTSIDGEILNLYNKYSSEVIESISLKSQDIDDVLDVDIRYGDDYIIILHKKGDDLYLWQSDSGLTDVMNHKLESYISDLDYASFLEADNTTYYLNDGTGYQTSPITITFSDTDSNIFYVNNHRECHTRHLTNPSYPVGRLDSSELFYAGRFIWGETIQQYQFFDFIWNSGHDTDPSNMYNNILTTHLNKNDKMYTLLHNNGRLYTINQPNVDRYFNNISLNLEKNYTGTVCSNSSIGIFFNTNIKNLIKDTLNIMNKSSASFEIHEREVLAQTLENYTTDSKNLYINGNETINIIALQRIFLTIHQIQSKLLSISMEN